MKKILFAAFTLLCLSGCSPKQAKGFDTLTAENHPRLFASESEFSRIRKMVARNDGSPISLIHATAMEHADSDGLCPEPLEYKKDASGKRILSVSRYTLTRIFTAAYAYRITGNEKYLHHAEWDINTVCDFPDWNPSHYLDCAEMSTAVAIGYDWLYPQLQDSTKAKVVRTIQNYAFETSKEDKYTSWYNASTNWNQVCNAGLVCAAVATFEHNPEESRRIIEKAVQTNSKAVEDIYAPIGAYPEGPVYWCYGNMYQTMMLDVLDSTLGTDFGISNIIGFSQTGDFEIFAQGNTGQFLNYADNKPESFPLYALWYFADRFKRPDLVYNEIQNYNHWGRVSKHEYERRLIPLAIIHASRIKPSKICPPQRASFISEEKTPVAIFRTGWDRDDLYLGVKGGKGGAPHGHCDAGEFFFEADGVRWASDLARQEYVELENPCKAAGSDLWAKGQNSIRYQLFRYNNLQHNCISIDGMTHDVSGFAAMTAKYTSGDKLGAQLDLTPLYFGKVSRASRSAAIIDKEYLQICDSITVADTPVQLRWTLVSEGEPQITEDGIVLSANGKSMILKAECIDESDGRNGGVCYQIWPSDPKACGWPTAYFEDAVPEHICGFTLNLHSGQSIALRTTMRRNSRR